MRIPNQSIGINRNQTVSRMIKGSIYPSRKLTAFDFRSACNSCSLSHVNCDYTRDVTTGFSFCTCQTEQGKKCVQAKIKAIEAEPRVAPPPPKPNTGSDFTIRGILTNPFVAEVTNDRRPTLPFPVRTSLITGGSSLR